jgi:hypothetical protein
MRRIWTSVFAVTISALLLLAATAIADPAATPGLAPAVPDIFSYQGRLVDKNTGDPANGQYDMVFAIYDDPGAVMALWTQTAPDVEVVDGQFTVYLGGSGHHFPEDLFTGGSLWLGVRVDPDPEMTPRTRLATVPYALRAESLRAGGVTSEDMAGTLYKFQNTDPGGYALVSEGKFHVQGDAHVEGTLSWAERTGRISVPAPAFQPNLETYQFSISGGSMWTEGGENYHAPIFLPDGSTVTKMTFFYDDSAPTQSVTVSLRRWDLSSHTYLPMAEVTSLNGGWGNGYDDSIMFSQVDNEHYSYHLRAEFSSDTALSNLKVETVIVEYEYTKP